MDNENVIKDKFKSLEVFGKKLTVCHLNSICSEVRNTIEDFALWMHIEGFLPVPNTDFEERRWYKIGRQNRYSSIDLYIKYLESLQKLQFKKLKK